MRAVVTGASGFIGSAVVDQLVAAGWPVCILLRPGSHLNNKYAGIADVNALHYNSLGDKHMLNALKAWQPEVFINMAWKGVGGTDRSQAYQFIDNITYTLQSVKLAAESGCTQWIGAGSQAEYGIHNTKITEDFACQPLTAYGKAKLAASIASLGMCESLQIGGTWTRIFSVYGPGDHSNTFINYTISSFLSNKAPELTPCEQKWDYLFITDAAHAIQCLAKSKSTGVFNVASGSTVVLKDVVGLLKQGSHYRGDVHFGGKGYASRQIMHLEADVTKLKQQTGWQPLVSFEEGLKQTLLVMQENSIHESI